MAQLYVSDEAREPSFARAKQRRSSIWRTSIFIGASRKPDDSYQQPEKLLLKYGDRHGLITGATGTGKTVSLQILAEGFSNQGVPVFAADLKGDFRIEQDRLGGP